MRSFRLLSLGLLAAAGMTGCSPKEGATPGAGPDSAEARPHIALIMKSLANEFFKTMEQGAREFQAAEGDRFDLMANGIPNEEDVSGQISLVEQMVAQGVDAIVIAPADSKALAGVLDRAMKEGIVVVNIDNKLDPAVLSERNLRIPFVGPDNRAGARLAADYVGTKLQPGDAVAIIEGIPSAFNGQQRKLGLDEGLKAAGLTIVTSQSANWEMAKASEIAAGILNEHPEIRAILCANDSMALGAHAAVRDAGKSGKVLVTGYDNIGAVAALVESGEILCTVDQQGEKLAVYGIEYALDILENKSAPEDRQTPVGLVAKGIPGAAASQ